MSTLFDPASILNTPLNEANATRRDPLPMADAVPAQVLSQEIVTGDIKKGENAGKTWAKLNVKLEITDPEYLAKCPNSPTKVVTTYGIMIDFNEGGGLAFGPNKNVNLGKFRAATGTNEPNKSLADAVGRMVRAKIGHRVDPDDSSIVYDEVKGVAPY